MLTQVFTTSLALLLLLGPVTAQGPLDALAAPEYQGLPNGGFDGDVDEEGVGSHFRISSNAEIVDTDVARGQSVNLAKTGAAPNDSNILSNVRLEPYQGTLLRDVTGFSFSSKAGDPLGRFPNFALFLRLDRDNDGAADYCMVTRQATFGAHDWTARGFGGDSLFWESGAGCGTLLGPLGSPQQSLSVWRASPTHATAVVLGVYIQVEAANAGVPWASGQILVDDAVLKVAEEPGSGPLGHHAQFTFTPPLVAKDGAESFDLSQGSVHVLVKLYDNLGRPKDFRNGIDPDGTVARARMVLNGNDESAELGEFHPLKSTGTVNPARQNEATFVLPAADLLHLQQATTNWEMHVESRYERFTAGGETFPYAFAFYNRQANADFARGQPAAADALDALPSLVQAILRPAAAKFLEAVPEAVASQNSFQVKVAVVDEAGRPIATEEHDVRLEKVQGPGTLIGGGTRKTDGGVASFTVSLDKMGDYALRASSPAVAGFREAQVKVQPGAIAGLRIMSADTAEVVDQSIVADDQTLYQAMGVDGAGNPVQLVAAKWSLLGEAIGEIDPADTATTPSNSLLLKAITVGTGRLKAEHVTAAGLTLADETGSLRVVAGPIDHIEILGGDRAINANQRDAITFTATGRDPHGNAVVIPSTTPLTWAVSQGGGAFSGNVLTPSGTQGVYTITATHPTAGSDTVTFTITQGIITLLAIQGTPHSVVAGSTEKPVYAVKAFDAGGNEKPISSADDVDWTITPAAAGNGFSKNILTVGAVAGTYTLTAKLTVAPSILSTQAFTITPGPWTSFAISGGSRSVSSQSGALTFTATGRDAHSNVAPLDSANELTWTATNGLGTFNKNVLTLSGTTGQGVVRAAKVGDATKSHEVQLTVRSLSIASISIVQKSLVQRIGQLQPVDFTVTAKDTDGQSIDVDAIDGVQWTIAQGGGTFTKNRLVPGERAGAHVVSAVLSVNPSVRDTATFTIQPGPINSLEIQGGEVVQTLGAVRSLTLSAHALDARGNVADAAPDVAWSLSDASAGTLAGAVLSPADRIGTFQVIALLKSNTQITDRLDVRILGPASSSPAPTQVDPGESVEVSYVLPEDTVAARVEFIDSMTGTGVATLNLTKEMRDGLDVWVGRISLPKGVYERRLSYETADGEQKTVSEQPLRVGAEEKKDTPGPAFAAIILAVAVGAIGLRRRRV